MTTGDRSLGVVVVTHGQLATELLNAAEMIVGDLPEFTAVSIGWHDDVDGGARGDRSARSRRSMRGAGVLLLTDMFGGTPSNLGLTFLEAGQVEVVTGVNLPMLIKLAEGVADERDLRDARASCASTAATAIRVASDLLRADRDPAAPRRSVSDVAAG